MGSFEKLVVLTLVFLSIVVLVFSLGSRGGGVEPRSPGDALGRGAATARAEGPDLAARSGGVQEPAAADWSETSAEFGPSAGDESVPATQGSADASVTDAADSDAELLASGAGDPARRAALELLQADARAAAEAPAEVPDWALEGQQLARADQPESGASGAPLLSAGAVEQVDAADETLPMPAEFDATGRTRILRETAGLRRSPQSDALLYTCGENENWVALSNRFYRTSQHAGLLRMANDAVAPPAAGTQISVPIYRAEASGGRAAPRRVPGSIADRAGESLVPASSGTVPGLPETESGPAPTPAADEAVPTYVIQSGDTLSSIAERFYGNANAWALIFEQNSDVLGNPDRLVVDIEIRLPGATHKP